MYVAPRIPAFSDLAVGFAPSVNASLSVAPFFARFVIWDSDLWWSAPVTIRALSVRSTMDRWTKFYSLSLSPFRNSLRFSQRARGKAQNRSARNLQHRTSAAAAVVAARRPGTPMGKASQKLCLVSAGGQSGKITT